MRRFSDRRRNDSLTVRVRASCVADEDAAASCGTRGAQYEYQHRSETRLPRADDAWQKYEKWLSEIFHKLIRD
jgi:hypothetical protein